MRFRDRRCNRCGDKYSFQESGRGCFYDINDKEFCPHCKQDILFLIESIPIKFEGRYRNIKEIERFNKLTSNIVLKWEKDRFEECKRENKLIFQKIITSEPNLEFGVYLFSREIVGQDEYKGYKFKLSTWPEHLFFNEDIVEIKMEYDCINDKFTGEIWE